MGLLFFILGATGALDGQSSNGNSDSSKALSIGLPVTLAVLAAVAVGVGGEYSVNQLADSLLTSCWIKYTYSEWQFERKLSFTDTRHLFN